MTDETETYTASQAAEKLGCNSRTIRRAAEKLEIGNKVNPRLWLVTSADLARIKGVIQDGPGQPRKKSAVKRPAE